MSLAEHTVSCLRCGAAGHAIYCEPCRRIVAKRAEADHEENGERRCDGCGEWHAIESMTLYKLSVEYLCAECDAEWIRKSRGY